MDAHTGASTSHTAQRPTPPDSQVAGFRTQRHPFEDIPVSRNNSYTSWDAQGVRGAWLLTFCGLSTFWRSRKGEEPERPGLGGRTPEGHTVHLRDRDRGLGVTLEQTHHWVRGWPRSTRASGEGQTGGGVGPGAASLLCGLQTKQPRKSARAQPSPGELFLESRAS